MPGGSENWEAESIRASLWQVAWLRGKAGGGPCCPYLSTSAVWPLARLPAVRRFSLPACRKNPLPAAAVLIDEASMLSLPLAAAAAGGEAAKVFRLGDCVIQQQNDYDKEVFNGDQGRVSSPEE